MTDALLADISSWQPAQLDWNAYVAWSKQGDGVPRVIFRASQGTNLKDANFETYWSGAIGSGVEEIGVYHYCYPQYNSAQAEANWFFQCVGSRLRPNDFIMIDFEENNPAASDAWLLAFAQALESLFGRVPYIYSYLSLIENNLHNPALAHYPLVLADWTFNPDYRPGCPLPFTDLEIVQYSDKVNVPGIGDADADVFVGNKGVHMSVPNGWSDDGSTLTAPNGVSLKTGMRSFVLSESWDPRDQPQAPEYNADPVTILHPEYGAGTRVDFVYSSVGWSRGQDKIFFIESGKEVVALRGQVSSANAAADSANKAASDAQAGEAAAQAAQAKAESDAKAAIADLNAEKGKNLVLTGEVDDLGKRIDSLNHDVASEHAAYLNATQQLAAEMSQVKNLEKQVQSLLSSSKGPENEDIKTQLIELSDSLPLLPEVKKVVDSIISKL